MAIKKIEKGLYTCLTSDIRKTKPSRFGKKATVYVRPSEKKDFKYIINLVKTDKYKTSPYSWFSRVEDAVTHKKLIATAGSKKPFTPYFIYDFLSR